MLGLGFRKLLDSTWRIAAGVFPCLSPPRRPASGLRCPNAKLQNSL